MKSLVFANGCIVTPGGIVERGSVEVREGRIAAVANSGAADRANGGFIDLGGDYLLPGFVDVQVNGGGGRHPRRAQVAAPVG